jgi:integrase
MRAVLTERLLRSLAAKGQPHEPIWDQGLRGFGIRIGERGTVSFFAMSRRRGGGRKPIRLTVGRYPALALAEARDRARLLLRELQDGVDPRERAAERLRAAAAGRANQFGAIAEQFIRRHVVHARTANAIELRIRREMVARWGDQPITSLRRADVVAMIDDIVDRGHPEAARQTFVYTRRLFRWAVARGLLEHAPTDHLNAKDLVGVKKPRQRLLSDSDLALIWCAAAQAPYRDGPYVQLLLLLGVRRTELGKAVWSELDLDKAIWVIPSARMKSDEGHAVPLPPRAVEILRSLPRFASDHVFTARGTKPLNDFGEVKRRLDLRIAGLNGGQPIEPWTLHDTRRVFRTGLSTLGTAPHVAELCLAHRQPGLARTYDLHRFDAEKRHALNAWSARLLSIVEPSPPNVTILRRAT